MPEQWYGRMPPEERFSRWPWQKCRARCEEHNERCDLRRGHVDWHFTERAFFSHWFWNLGEGYRWTR